MGHLAHKRNGCQQTHVDQDQTQRNRRRRSGRTSSPEPHREDPEPAIKAVSGRPSRAEITLMSTSGPKTTDQALNASSFVGVPIIFSEEYREPRS